LVFSSLHTTDGPTAVTRMVDMGVPGYLVASSVIAVLAQRLVRVVCNRCKQSYTPPESVLLDVGITPERAKHANFVRGKGCSYCQRKGYRGRIAVFEIMLVTAKVRELIFNAENATEIRKVAIQEGMSTLYMDAVRKAMAGVTTLEEVYRVTKRTEQDVILA